MGSINRGHWKGAVIKPPFGSQIDWGHPLSKGLVGAALLNEGYARLATFLPYKVFLNQGNSYTWGIDRNGFYVSGGSVRYDTALPPLEFTDEFSLVAGVIRTIDDTNYGEFAAYGDYFTSNSDCGGYALGLAPDAEAGNPKGLYLLHKNNNQSSFGNNLAITTGGVWTLGDYIAMAATVKLGVSAKLYKNGVLTADNTSVDTAINYSGGPSSRKLQIRLGSGPYNVYHAYYYNRRLTVDEIQWLRDDPYAFVEAPSTRTFSIPDNLPASTTQIVSLPRKRNWGQVKPPLGAQIDWSHPLSKNLLGCWLMNEQSGKFYDLASRQDGDATSGLTRIIGLGGAGINCPGPSAFGKVQIASPSKFDNLPALTIVCLTNLKAFPIGSSNSIVGKSYSTDGSFEGWTLNVQDSSGYHQNLEFFANYNSGGSPGGFQAISPEYSIALNTLSHIAVSWDGTDDYSKVGIYNNGVKLTVTGFNGGGSRPDDSGRNLYLGGIHSDSQNFTGQLFQVLIYNRALSASEIQQLYLEPYAFIQTPSTRTFSIPSTIPTTSTQIVSLPRKKKDWDGLKPPFVETEIDWKNPIAKNLVFCVVQHYGVPIYDLVRRIYASAYSGGSYGYFKYDGKEKDAVAPFLSWRFYDRTGLDDITSKGAIFLIGTSGNYTDSGFAIKSQDYGNANLYLGFGFDDGAYAAITDNLSAIIGNQTRICGTNPSILGANYEDRYHRVLMHYDSAWDAVYFYANGKYAGGDNLGGGITPASSVDRLTDIGSSVYYYAENGCQNALIYAWDRTLSDWEIQQLADDPYYFIKKPTFTRSFSIQHAIINGWGKLIGTKRNRLVVTN